MLRLWFQISVLGGWTRQSNHCQRQFPYTLNPQSFEATQWQIRTKVKHHVHFFCGFIWINFSLPKEKGDGGSIYAYHSLPLLLFRSLQGLWFSCSTFHAKDSLWRLLLLSLCCEKRN